MTTTAPIGLDAEQRSTLERLVIRARSLLEDDLAAQAEGRFGIHLDGAIEDEAALPDDTTDKATRRDLELIVAHLRSLGEDPAGAVARLLREASFTHLNRLVAIRIAEAIGLLPESLANGPQSQGFKDLGEIMPVLAGDYRSYVRLCGDELAADAPALFDPRNPLLALEPSTAAFDGLVALLSSPDTAEIWQAPDALGWAYQFFNTGDERREMRESAAPRNSRELAVRNQFFTPRYVVDFLVQNSLGRRLIESDPTSRLLDELPLLVDPPTEAGTAIDLGEVKCLDPACGSGHFLLGCYDILERAWELAGTSAAESAPRIVASLWGVDVDPRCAQVASAAITLRARRHCRDLTLPRPNIVTARGLPGGSAALPAEVDLRAAQRELIDRVSDVLADAPVLGVLLKAEEALEQEIRFGAFGGGDDFKPGMLELTDEAADATERQLLDHLQAIADQASSSVVERLLAAEADDALRLVEVVRQRYDAVLMNPPFGEPVAETKDYLKATYRWAPPTADLFSIFVGRGLELCKQGGYLGAITPRVGMFLTTFGRWRSEVLLDHRLVALADLGHGVMQQALVEAAAYVVQAAPSSEAPSTFVRLLRALDRPAALQDAVANRNSGKADDRVFAIETSDIALIPGSPLAYWVHPSLRDLFGRFPRLEVTGADVRVGSWPGDDFRHLRLWWEIKGPTPAPNMTWVPYVKGGEYSPYYSEPHLVVCWDSARGTFRDFFGRKGRPTPIPENVDYYFRSGVCWPRRTASGFGVRALPRGCVFADKGPAAFPNGRSEVLLLGWLNSRLSRACVDLMVAAGEETSSGGASRSYEVGIVQRIPWPAAELSNGQVADIENLVAELVRLRAARDVFDETSRAFVAPLRLSDVGASLGDAIAAAFVEQEDQQLQMVAASARAEQIFHQAIGVVAEDAQHYLDAEAGPHPDDLKDSPIEDETLFAELFSAPMDATIDRIIQAQGGRRVITNLNFVADRRMEVLAHSFDRHPRVIAQLRKQLQLLPPEEPRRTADRLISYLVGVAFGRWDVRIARDPSAFTSAPLEPFDELPAVPAAMLLGPGGLPGYPANYPLELPPGRVLIDEPGHVWDIEAAVLRAADAVLNDAAAVVPEMLGMLGRRTVREHLRKQFFKDHLSRYSRSRRKAPIYWPLGVPSKSWAVWVYAPSLTRETLYAVAGEAGRRERLAVEAILRLQREQQDGARPQRKVAEDLDAEESLAEELRRFRAEAERVAGLGWEPNLDDGAVLCAAPLADLIPAWPDAKAARVELRKGNYDWATVAKWAEVI